MIIRVLFLVMAVAMPYAVLGTTQLAEQKTCFACHSVDKAMYGPAFRAIAERYQGQPNAVATLTKKIINGGAGIWGNTAMPPNALTPTEAAALVTWVLRGAPATEQKIPSAAPHVAAAVRPIVPEQVIRNGRYLVEHVMGCGNCHAGRTPDTGVIPGMELAGGRVYDLPQYFAQPGNLTSDNETGIGRWSLTELARAVTAYFGDRDQRFRLIVNKRGSGCAKREFIGLCSRSLRNLMSEVIHGRARGYPHGA